MDQNVKDSRPSSRAPSATKLSTTTPGSKLSATFLVPPSTATSAGMADGANIKAGGSPSLTSANLLKVDSAHGSRASGLDHRHSSRVLNLHGDHHSKHAHRATVTIDQQLTTERLVRLQRHFQDADKDRVIRSRRQVKDAEDLGRLLELKREFQEVDTDRGGSISIDEFRAALQRTVGGHVTDEEADMVFMKVDTNCDGMIDWEEYLSYVLLECRERDLMRIMAREPYLREPKFCRAENRDVIVSLHFIPSATGGRYLSASKEGLLTFWSKKFTTPVTQRVVKGAIGSTPIWVTAVEVALDARLVVVATSNCDLTWYFYGTKSLERISRIHQLPGSVLAMSFYTEARHEGSNRISYLAWGDEFGGLGLIIFSRCPSKTDVGNPSQTDEEKKKKAPKATRYFFFTDISNGNVQSLGARYHARIHNRYVRQIRYIHKMRCWLSCAKDTATAFLLGDLIHEMPARPTFWTVDHGVNAFDYCEKLNVIVTGGFDTVIRLWNPLAEESKLAGFLKGHISPVTHLMVNNKQENLVSMAENKDILIFDLNTTHCIQTLYRKALRPMGVRPFSAAILHQHINRLVMATKSIAIISSRSDETSALLTTGKERLVTVMLYNSLFKQVVTGDERSRVSVYDIFSGEKTMQFTVQTIIEKGETIEAEITAMTFDPTRRRLATGTRDGIVKIWNFNNGTLLRELPTADRNEITSIAWPPTRILVAGWSKHVTSYLEVAENDEFRTLKPEHMGDILCVNVYPPRLAISASVDGGIIVWSLDTSYPQFMFSTLFPDEPASSDFYKQASSVERKSGKKDAGNQDWFRMSAGREVDPGRKSYWGGNEGQTLLSPRTNQAGQTGLRVPGGGGGGRGSARESPGMIGGTTPFNASVEVLLVLTRREMGEDVAVLLTCLTNGHVLSWPLHLHGKCLGDFFGASADGESINCADITEDNEFLITGDSAGYIKVWDISHYRCGAHGPTCCQETDALREPVWNEFPYVRMRRVTDALRMSRSLRLPLHLKCKCTATEAGPPTDAIDANPPHLVNCLYAHMGGLVGVVAAKIDGKHIIASSSTDYSIRLWTIHGQYLGLFGSREPWRNVRSLKAPARPKASPVTVEGPTTTTTEGPKVAAMAATTSPAHAPSAAAGPSGGYVRNSVRVGLPSDLRRVASYTTMYILETEAGTRKNSRWSIVRNAVAWMVTFMQNRMFAQDARTVTFTIPGAQPEKAAAYSNNLREMIEQYEKGAMAYAGHRRKQKPDLQAQAAERDAGLLRPLPPQTSSVLGKSYRKPTRYRPIERLQLDESISGEVSPYRALPCLDIVQQPPAEMLSSPALASIKESHYLPPIDPDIGLNLSRKPSDPAIRMMQALKRAGWLLKSDRQLQRCRVPINGPFRKSMIMIPSLALTSEEELRRMTIAARKSSNLSAGARLSKSRSHKLDF